MALGVILGLELHFNKISIILISSVDDEDPILIFLRFVANCTVEVQPFFILLLSLSPRLLLCHVHNSLYLLLNLLFLFIITFV